MNKELQNYINEELSIYKSNIELKAFKDELASDSYLYYESLIKEGSNEIDALKQTIRHIGDISNLDFEKSDIFNKLFQVCKYVVSILLIVSLIGTLISFDSSVVLGIKIMVIVSLFLLTYLLFSYKKLESSIISKLGGYVIYVVIVFLLQLNSFTILGIVIILSVLFKSINYDGEMYNKILIGGTGVLFSLPFFIDVKIVLRESTGTQFLSLVFISIIGLTVYIMIGYFNDKKRRIVKYISIGVLIISMVLVVIYSALDQNSLFLNIANGLLQYVGVISIIASGYFIYKKKSYASELYIGVILIVSSLILISLPGYTAYQNTYLGLASDIEFMMILFLNVVLTYSFFSEYYPKYIK